MYKEFKIIVLQILEQIVVGNLYIFVGELPLVLAPNVLEFAVHQDNTVVLLNVTCGTIISDNFHIDSMARVLVVITIEKMVTLDCVTLCSISVLMQAQVSQLDLTVCTTLMLYFQVVEICQVIFLV